MSPARKSRSANAKVQKRDLKSQKREFSQPGRVAQDACPHPKDKRKHVGYGTVCDDCKLWMG